MMFLERKIENLEKFFSAPNVLRFSELGAEIEWKFDFGCFIKFL